jgi:hypothetical protein
LVARVGAVWEGFGAEDVVVDVVVAAIVGGVLGAPAVVEDGEPFIGAGVAVVVLVEGDAVLEGFVAPPGADNVEGEAASADAVDAGGLLGEQSGVVEGGSDGDHQLELFSDGCERGGGGPCVERVGFDALYVVEIQFGNEGEVVAEVFGLQCEIANVVPRCGHLFVVDVAKPAAEDGEPKAVAHLGSDRCSFKILHPLVRAVDAVH